MVYLSKVEIAADEAHLSLEGAEMEVGRDEIAGLYERLGEHVLARPALMDGEEILLAQYLAHLIRHAVIARAARIGIIGKVEGARLRVAHGVEAGIGDHIDEHVLGL